MEIVLAVAALMAGIVIGYLLARSKSGEQVGSVAAQRDVLQSKLDGLQEQLQETRDKAAQDLQEAHEQATDTQHELKNGYEQQLAKAETLREKQLAEMKDSYEKQLAAIKEQHREQMLQQSALIKEQIKTSSEEILKQRSDELSATNREQLSAILNPLHENLKQMKEAVEKSDRQQTTTMERLDASIKENLRQAQEVGERADKLAKALTGENKTQGNFGEFNLREKLLAMGLEEGVQFEEQVMLKDNQENIVREEERGKAMIPDVVLHFPDNRDVVIDSKVSLTAYADYYNADTDEQRELALKRHIASVRSHVKELARKNYSNYIRDGHQKLDFVFMYVYPESALQLALSSDPRLWRDAYQDGVVISGSQNLYMMLRVLALTWKQVRQVENQQNIIDAANMIVDRVQVFYERFLNVDEQLRKTTGAFDEMKRSTASNGKSIITAANKLIKYGAQQNPKRKRKLPDVEDEAQEEIEDKQ